MRAIASVEVDAVFVPLMCRTLRDGLWAIHLEAARVPDAGQHVGGERGGQGVQVLLHDHVANRPTVDGRDGDEDGAVCEPEYTPCRHAARPHGRRRSHAGARAAAVRRARRDGGRGQGLVPAH